MELTRRTLNPETEPRRVMELAAYFTHCQLQPAHVLLSLQSAMACTFKLRNFAGAAHFARRLLDMNPQLQKVESYFNVFPIKGPLTTPLTGQKRPIPRRNLPTRRYPNRIRSI